MSNHDEVMGSFQAFFKSRVILTACEFDIFTLLHETPLAAAELATRLGTDLRALTRVLDCLVAFEFLSKKQGIYTVTASGSRLSSRHPETILPMALHSVDLWKTWSTLTEVVRDGPRQKESVAVLDNNTVTFISAMHAIGLQLSYTLANEYDCSRFTRLLDIGGASGTYTIAFLNTNPRMEAVIFDLESVIPLAKEHIAAEGLSHRVEFVAGDFYRDDLPAPADLALLSAIIHQNSPEQNIDLYQKAYQSLEPGGAILIRDVIMDPSRTAPQQGTVFAINMLVNTAGGDTYTFAEVTDHLQKAGFEEVTFIRHDKEHMGSLIEAWKPA